MRRHVWRQQHIYQSIYVELETVRQREMGIYGYIWVYIGINIEDKWGEEKGRKGKENGEGNEERERRSRDGMGE